MEDESAFARAHRQLEADIMALRLCLGCIRGSAFYSETNDEVLVG